LLFNIFEDAQESIADFIQLLQLYENVIPDKTKVLSIKSVMHYYLGGAVSSYIIFDERLDDGDYTLSSQEYYYYALTAQEINREAEAILNNAISEVSNKTDKTSEDFYYLAHLYLLQGNETKAIENFKQSDDFIFSIIMLACKSKDEIYIKQVRDINPADIYNFSTEIDCTRKDLSQFQHFFHICECKVANSFDESISQFLLPDKYNDSFWKIFKFSSLDKRNIIALNTEIEKLEIEKNMGCIPDEYYQYFWSIIEYAIQENKNIHDALREKDAKKKLDKYLKKFKEQLENEINNIDIDEEQRKLKANHLDSFKIMRDIEDAKNKNMDMENFTGLLIEKLEHNNHLFYLYLLRLQYLKKEIDSNAVFYLYFYWLRTVKKKYKIEIDNLVFDLGKTVVPSVGFKVLFTIAKPAWAIVKQILKDYEEYDPTAPSDYMQFRKNFWEYIAADKERLSDSEFERKYRYFEWFENKKL
jgi:hypothetical protein